ncbi:MAG: NUDIX domain-containing protein [Chthoniobacterales bacterium]|nr:MAG: NUDIX domain-containing protein [Chthoniobacterales bacterium]
MIYRPAVAAILQDRSGRILICERADRPGAWQFPQGGIESGETPVNALVREVAEEISLPRNAFSITSVRGPYRYRFPASLTKKGFRGQAHHYFLLRLRGSKRLVNVAAANAEFRQARWIQPREFNFAWLPAMKRPVYRRVLRDFFGTQ